MQRFEIVTAIDQPPHAAKRPPRTIGSQEQFARRLIAEMKNRRSLMRDGHLSRRVPG
jgi:hypothetical protein